MNAQQVNKASLAYAEDKKGGASEAEVRSLIKADHKGIIEKDIVAILKKVFAGVTTPVAKTADIKKNNNMNAQQEKRPSPNDALDLSGFDYKKLTGASFKEYVELVGDRKFLILDEETGKMVPVISQLQLNADYDFVKFKMQPIMKERYPGVEGTPKDFIGLKMIKDEALHTSRMPVKVALEHNAQIDNQHSLAGHGTYYLLKQPE